MCTISTLIPALETARAQYSAKMHELAAMISERRKLNDQIADRLAQHDIFAPEGKNAEERKANKTAALETDSELKALKARLSLIECGNGTPGILTLEMQIKDLSKQILSMTALLQYKTEEMRTRNATSAPEFVEVSPGTFVNPAYIVSYRERTLSNGRTMRYCDVSDANHSYEMKNFPFDDQTQSEKQDASLLITHPQHSIDEIPL
jgi:hypothetical protein